MKIRASHLCLALGLAMVALALLDVSAIAQTGHNPFAVAGDEGSASPTGIGGWILAQQSVFDRMLSGAVRAVKANGWAFWTLAGISFAYGVLHAAGPGHGKAVVASYMVANERALKRGIAISFFAAILQGCVAIAIVAGASLVLGAAAPRIKQASGLIDTASFLAVAALGAWLSWRKGRAFIAALGGGRQDASGRTGLAASAAGAGQLPGLASSSGPRLAYAFAANDADPVQPGRRGGFVCETVVEGHVHDAFCGHFHAPDPAELGDGFSWKSAILTVFSAGSRPCSGAILVLIYSLAQGIFLAGVAATFAMSLGTAITTAALAATAVLFKGLAVKLVGGGSRRNELIARGVEVVAALAVLLVGLALLTGQMQAGA